MGRIIPYIMENKHVWNHQPALFYPYEMGITTMGSGRSPHFFRSNPAPPTSGYERWTMMRPENTPGSFQLREQQRKLSFCWWVYTVYIYIHIYIIYLQIYIYIYMFIPHYVFDWNVKPSHIWVLAIKNCISLHAKKNHVSCERKKSGGPPEIWGFNRFMSCQLGSFKIQHDGWSSAENGGYKGG